MWKNINFGILIVISIFSTLASLWYQPKQFHFNGTNILTCLHLPLENLNYINHLNILVVVIALSYSTYAFQLVKEWWDVMGVLMKDYIKNSRVM